MPTPPSSRTRRARAARALAALACACAPAAPAWAQASPWYVGASQTFTRDDNLLRLADGQAVPAGFARADTVSSTALIAGLDQPIGRQRLFGSVTLRDNRLSRNAVFDNQGYALTAGVDWQTVNRLSGTVRAGANRSLARFNSDEIGLVTKRNLETTQSLDASVRLGVVTRLTLEAALGTRSVDYSAEEYRSREFRQSSVSAGARYRLGGATTVGAGLRLTEGRYPSFRALGSGQFQADRLDRRDLDLSVAWVPSAVSSVDARLSFGKTDYEIATARGFSGVTGALNWVWRPTGKLRLTTQLTRDPGQDSYFLDNRVSDATVEYSRLSTAVRLRTDYAVSAKVAAYVSAARVQRSLARTLPALPGLDPRVRGSDHSTLLALGATWTPQRWLQLGCDLSRERRRGEQPLSNDYSTGSVGCSAQVTLQ